MSSTDNAVRVAVCPNIDDCPKALSREAIAWYPGPGEYCPECGEALSELASTPPAADLPSESHSAVDAPPREEATLETDVAARPSPPATDRPLPPNPPLSDPAIAARSALRVRPPKPPVKRRRWLWFTVGGCLVVAVLVAVLYARRAVVAVDRPPADVVAICAIPSAKQLAADLVHAYAAKSATSAGRFEIMGGRASVCAVSFANSSATPDAVIARDGIVAVVNPLNPIARVTEPQLRAIYSGRIRDWSQLGGPRGAIVPILPDPNSDEAKALASSLFFGVSITRVVQRRSSSADVTRAVTGADRASRGAIGLVTFSQAVPAKVVPLAYWPPPSVLSIASHRYPYTLAIAVGPGSDADSAPPGAEGFINYARSGDGAAVVAKSGLIPREGL